MKVILLHGLGQTPNDWTTVTSALGNDYDIDTPHLIDLAHCDNVTFQTIYQGLENYLEQFTEPFVICGISLGGMLALKYTLEHAKKVHKLVLIGARANMPKLLMSIQHVIMQFVPNGHFERLGMSKKNIIALSKSTLEFDVKNRLPQLACPVCVIVGGKDIANKSEAMRLSKAIPQANLHVIDNVGHAVNTENPRQLAQIMSDFLKQ